MLDISQVTFATKYDLQGWFDGSCRPFNPGGYGGWGIILKDSAGNVLHKAHGCLGNGPHMSNNVAEHHACANLLELVADLAGNGWRVLIKGDSKLVIKQIFGHWKAKKGLYVDEYKRGKAAIRKLRCAGVTIEGAWIPRDSNTEADELSTASEPSNHHPGWRCALKAGGVE